MRRRAGVLRNPQSGVVNPFDAARAAFRGRVSGDPTGAPDWVREIATVGTGDPHDDAHRGRLARPVGAHEAEHHSGWDGEAHPVERDLVPVPLAQALHLKHGRP